MSTSESQKKATIKYAKENLKRVPLDVKKEDYDRIKEAAELTGKSVRAFIIDAIEEKISKV